MPFVLKNVEATFQWAMSYAFHDIKKIVEAYLDDLVAHSKKRADHSPHRRAIFDICRMYKIRLNPLKCNSFVVTGRLL
jgi:ketosteroid isomerase-like protein